MKSLDKFFVLFLYISTMALLGKDENSDLGGVDKLLRSLSFGVKKR